MQGFDVLCSSLPQLTCPVAKHTSLQVFSAWLQYVSSLEAVCSLCRRGTGSSTSNAVAGNLACNVYCDAVKCSACTLQVEWMRVQEQPYISAYRPRPPAKRALYRSSSGSSLGTVALADDKTKTATCLLESQHKRRLPPGTCSFLIMLATLHAGWMNASVSSFGSIDVMRLLGMPGTRRCMSSGPHVDT